MSHFPTQFAHSESLHGTVLLRTYYNHIFHMWELITYQCSSAQTLYTSEISIYRPENEYNSHELPFVERYVFVN